MAAIGVDFAWDIGCDPDVLERGRPKGDLRQVEGEAPVNYDLQEQEQDVTIRLEGRVTYADHAHFRDIINRVRGASAPRVVVDLAGVEFIDSAGLGMLLMMRDTAEAREATVVLRGAQGQVARIIAASKFESLFTLES